MAELKWKSYGDTGLTAEGDKGTWRIVTDGAWWHLSLQPPLARGMLSRGKFYDRLDAAAYAQDREDGVEVVAQGEVELPREHADARIQAQIASVCQRWPENFRESLAFYVGSRVEWTGDREAWRKKVFDIVALVLLGIEDSEFYELVAK